MDIDEVIDNFRRKAIDLDCRQMVLTQNKDRGARLEGPGYIRQSEDGTLTFKIYVVRHENAHPFGHIEAQLETVAGKLYGGDMFYDLVAIGHDGTRWSAAQILPAIHWDVSAGGVLIDGRIQALSARLNLCQPQSYLRLHFFEEYNVPLNLTSETEKHGDSRIVRDRAEFEACGSAFEVRKRDGSGDTVVVVTGPTAFPPAFHLRIQEALQYITGKPANWRARLESEGEELCLELASPWRKSQRTQFSPPIALVSIHYYERGWQLFACYLAYVVAKTDGPQWNPVAYHLYNACEATANSIDAWAVGVSVAVEAVAGLITLEDDLERAERVTAFQKRMRECLAAQSDFADLAPRMEGLIKAMAHKRPQDTLYTLASTGHVEKSYIEAWSYLRNRHVHPTLKDLKKPDDADYQKLLDHIHRVEVLLHQLTFCLIGYEGPFTDYGVANFASKFYPLNASEQGAAV